MHIKWRYVVIVIFESTSFQTTGHVVDRVQWVGVHYVSIYMHLET